MHPSKSWLASLAVHGGGLAVMAGVVVGARPKPAPRTALLVVHHAEAVEIETLKSEPLPNPRAAPEVPAQVDPVEVDEEELLEEAVCGERAEPQLKPPDHRNLTRRVRRRPVKVAPAPARPRPVVRTVRRPRRAGPTRGAEPVAGAAGIVYPRAARRQGIEGVVVLHLLLDEKGLVRKIELKQSSGHAILDQAALRAARHWRFQPALRNGVACRSTFTRRIRFRLR